MIITRTPFRIPIGGGGTDLPSYYQRFGGYFISAAIDKYMFLTTNWSFGKDIHLRYSKTEQVPIGEFDQIQHPIIREALKLTGIRGPIEIASMADILSGTGVGTSGSFTVGLLKGLYTYKREHISTRDLAEQACRINMELLQSGSGKQDEYIAAFGGITSFDINRDGVVTVKPLPIPIEAMYELEERLLLFHTGYTRSASDRLKEQAKATNSNDQNMIRRLHHTKDIGYRTAEALQTGEVDEFGRLMHEHWLSKRKRDSKISNSDIDNYYQVARRNGVIGGKLMGAGGGGFLLLLADDPTRLRVAMKKQGLEEIRFGFDFEGSKVIFNQEQYRERG